VPYTVSHIAAVMPGYKWLARAQVFSAAVIGSMVPDFGFLLPRYPARWETHSLTGLFTFCLPLGLIAYCLTQLLIKPAMVEALPDRVYLRLQRSHPPAALTSLRTWVLVSAAVLLGAFTHLIWDGFTHEGGRGVRALSFLSEFGPELDGHRLHLFRLLQFVSSIVGLAIVMIAMVVWVGRAPAPQAPCERRLAAPERMGWLILYLLPPTIMVSGALWRAWVTGISPFGNGYTLGGVAVASIRGAIISLVLVSLLLRIRVATT
jgi:hypothetical protein